MRRSPLSALARRAFVDARVRTLSFALLFLGGACAQTTGYREAAPTLADRVEFARNFGDNKAVRLLYGEPHDLLTVGGYVGWRDPRAARGVRGRLGAARRRAGAARRGGLRAGGDRAERAGEPPHDVRGRRARRAGRHRGAVAGAVPRAGRGRAGGRRVGVPGVGGRVRRARVRGRRRGHEPAGAVEANGDGPGVRACSRSRSPCAWWPTRPTAPAGCAGPRRSAGSRRCGRSRASGRRCCCCRSR